MATRALPTPRQRLLRQRQHGAILQQADRRELERAGWRTTLEFRENNLRARDGRLLHVEAVWHAEAERDAHQRPGRDASGGVDFVHATAESVDEVWSKLRRQAELADVRRHAESADHAAAQAC
ncbi:MAG TPA: hypothetical protein VMY16_10625 [Ilumatobacteraceae bacterium]|nr:hypothetical protein [Ilumatobacteraceae bacterium]